MSSTDPKQGTIVQPEGSVPAEIIRGKVENVHPSTFTVDVSSDYDRKFYEGVTVASPYVHHVGGAGYSVMPRKGAAVLLLRPSDSSPPCIIGFLPPFRPPAPADEDVDTSQLSPEQAARLPPASPRFDANRRPHAEGSQSLMGADDQGVIIHDSGVLETRAGSMNLNLYFTEGTRRALYMRSESQWPGGSALQSPDDVGYTDTTVRSRVLADKHPVSRVRWGGKPLGEPSNLEKSWKTAAAQVNLRDDDMVMEMSISPEGFDFDGLPYSDKTRETSVFRLLVTLLGVVFGRFKGMVLRLTNTLRVDADELIWLKSKKIVLESTGDVRLGGKGTTDIQGSVIKLGGGGRGVIAQGDIVTFSLPLGTVVTGVLSGQPFVGTMDVPSGPIAATLVSPGSPTVKVPLWQVN